MKSRSRVETVTEQVAVDLKHALDTAGMTQAQLARTLGVTPQRVSQMFSGRFNMTVASLVHVANALGRSIKIEFTYHGP